MFTWNHFPNFFVKQLSGCIFSVAALFCILRNFLDQSEFLKLFHESESKAKQSNRSEQQRPTVTDIFRFCFESWCRKSNQHTCGRFNKPAAVVKLQSQPRNMRLHSLWRIRLLCYSWNLQHNQSNRWANETPIRRCWFNRLSFIRLSTGISLAQDIYYGYYVFPWKVVSWKRFNVGSSYSWHWERSVS